MANNNQHPSTMYFILGIIFAGIAGCMALSLYLTGMWGVM